MTTSLLQAQIFMLDFQAARWLVKGEVAKQAGNNHPTSIPTGVFKTKDGHINIASTGQKFWERCCKVLSAPQMLANPDYANGAARSEAPRRAPCTEMEAPYRDGDQSRSGSTASTKPACHAVRSIGSTRCSPTRR